MNLFYDFMKLTSTLPYLVSLLVCPALLLVVGLLFAIFGAKKAYLPLAVFLGGAGFFLVYCKDASYAFAYLGLFAAFAVLVRLFFLIPFGGRKDDGDSQEDLYSKFHVALDVSEEELAPIDEEYFDRSESDLRLDHTSDLLEQLKKSELSATDRLEADALSHTLESYRGKKLSAEEMRRLNDCLATILKLTAKYKL